MKMSDEELWNDARLLSTWSNLTTRRKELLVKPAQAQWQCPGRRRCTWLPARSGRHVRAAPAPPCRRCVRRHAQWMAKRDGAAIGLTCPASSAMPSWRSTAMPCEAKASFSSMTSNCFGVRPSRAHSFCVAGAGPMPMMRGATPAAAPPRMRAIGVRPYFFTAASEATISAAAPSLTPEHCRPSPCRPDGTASAAWPAPRPWCRAGMLVLRHDHRIALALRMAPG